MSEHNPQDLPEDSTSTTLELQAMERDSKEPGAFVCPIETCEYHTNGFAREHDMNRHMSTHHKWILTCPFCPGPGMAYEKAFNNFDVFRRHLAVVHNVEPTGRTNIRNMSSNSGDASCLVCLTSFSTALKFYEHLHYCVLDSVVSSRTPEPNDDSPTARDGDAKKENILTTGRKLSFFLDGVCPSTPNLVDAYMKRVSDIEARSTGSRLDKSESKGIIPPIASSVHTHLVTCMIARKWKETDAISIWKEIIKGRGREISNHLNKLYPPDHAIFRTLEDHQEMINEQLVKWDARARQWLRKADSMNEKQHKRLLPALGTMSYPMDLELTTYQNVKSLWTSTMETLEKIICGVPCVVKDSTILVALSSWHLYPDIRIHAAKGLVYKIRMGEILVPTTGILSISLSDIHNDPEDTLDKLELNLDNCLYYFESEDFLLKKEGMRIKHPEIQTNREQPGPPQLPQVYEAELWKDQGSQQNFDQLHGAQFWPAAGLQDEPMQMPAAGPTDEPQIKSEFGRMFSGTGSGVRSIGAAEGPPEGTIGKLEVSQDAPSTKTYDNSSNQELGSTGSVGVERPRRVRTSRPKVKTGCDNCKQRRIKCDEKRPACTQCVRSKKTCTGYPPPPRPTISEEVSILTKPHFHRSLPKIVSQHPVQLLASEAPPSDSGYATISLHSRDVIERSPDSSGSDDEDIKTVYTEVVGLSDVLTDTYITTFSDDLFKRIGMKQLSEKMVERLSATMPELLKAFAFKFGYEASSQMHRDMMVFIHKHRDAIALSFKDNYHQAEELDPDATIPQEPRPTEIMDRWLTSSDETEFEPCHAEVRVAHPAKDSLGNLEPINTSEDEDLNIPGLDEYKKLIFKDPSYAWLFARLRNEIILSVKESSTLCDIRDIILWAIPRTNQVSRKQAPEGTQVDFKIDWDILAFFRDQDYDTSNAEAIADTVTLTGSRTHAQALSCRQYLAQMWPSTGLQTLELLQGLLSSEAHSTKLIFNTPSRLIVQAFIKNKSVVVRASGLPDFIAEIGEQLSWLGAALRCSPIDSRVLLCTAYVDQTRSVDDETSEFIIKYNTRLGEEDLSDVNGQCWNGLFANPVVACGFPIPRRDEALTGLEISLDMMVALVRARYVDTFKSKIFIKGFSTMLIPTKQLGNIVIWHLLRSKCADERISYLASGPEHIDITIADIERSRHILGWCSNAISIVGTTRATYAVGRSMLPYPHSGCALEKAEISAGQFVTGTAGFRFGNKEKPVHISRSGYLKKLQWISSKYVVFWDEEEKKGWLVNGASALLHILRASLEHSKHKFQSSWLLDPNALGDAADISRPESALRVLIDDRNRDLKLYIDKTEVYDEETQEGPMTSSVLRRQSRHYRLEDQVEHIYNILEKLIDHQTDAERRDGLQINPRPRRQLEGWDFRDIVKDGDPFFPRVATLQTAGKGWVDFIRAIHAVTLFGRGFGELIQPQRANTAIEATPCARWSLLPSGQYYLAACVPDLLEIMENNGDSRSNPRRLCDKIVWHMKKATFDPCPCIAGTIHGKHHDPVQALFPFKFTGSLQKKPQIELEDRGAVVFGQNGGLHWYWKDNGDPVKGDPPPESACVRDKFYDSGLGSSLGSSSNSRSVSDPSSSASTAGDTPPPPGGPESPSSDSQQGPVQGSKRRLQDMLSSISKRVK